METQIQSMVSEMLGKYGWLFLVGVMTLLFRSTIEKFVAGWMIFLGNDYKSRLYHTCLAPFIVLLADSIIL